MKKEMMKILMHAKIIKMDRKCEIKSKKNTLTLFNAANTLSGM